MGLAQAAAEHLLVVMQGMAVLEDFMAAAVAVAGQQLMMWGIQELEAMVPTGL
jgi:hypothetical protein